MNNLLSDSIALGRPAAASDHECTVDAIRAARAGRMPVEIRLGVGPIRGERLPARVLGHAKCVADTIRGDLALLIGTRCPTRITIFTSAPKAGVFNPRVDPLAIAALGCALRAVGIDLPVVLELSASWREVPCNLDTSVPPDLAAWLDRAAARSTNPMASIDYAREHASASMFGDLTEDRVPPVLRITVGAATEGPFWAVRQRVRQAAIASGMPVMPALVLVMKACRVPWYHAALEEPELCELAEPAVAIRRLETAANPALGGNAGLMREARAMRAATKVASMPHFVEAVDAVARKLSHVHALGFSIGPSLNSLINKGVMT